MNKSINARCRPNWNTPAGGGRLPYYLLSNLFTVFPHDASMLRLIRHMSSPVQVHPQTCVPRRVYRPTFKRRLESHLVLPVWSPLASHSSRSPRHGAASQSISRTHGRRRSGSRVGRAEGRTGAMVSTVGRKVEGIVDQRSVISTSNETGRMVVRPKVVM